MEGATHYALLGVPRDATPKQIRDAFYRQARRYHPDMRGGEYDDRYLAVAEAYAVLSDPERRAAYDATLVDTRRAGNGSRPPARGPARPRRHTRGAWTQRADAEPPWPYPEDPLPAPHGRVHLVGPPWWRRHAAAMPAREARARRTWGTPGARLACPGGAVVRTSADLCENSARVLAAELGDIPALRVFHAVALPGGAVVDHVLVCGRKVALVASAETAAPALGWRAGVLTDGTHHVPAPVTLDVVRDLSRHLQDAVVAAWVLLYAGPGASTSVTNRGAPPYVRLQTAGRGLREVRNWLLTGNDARVVDRVLLHRVHTVGTGPA